MKKTFILLALIIFLVQPGFSQKNEKPLIASRNFTNSNNLWESIGRGVVNFQADVMYIYGKLYVTSLMPDSSNHKLPTLTEAYLYPLFNQYKKNSSEILPGYSGDIFLILNMTTQAVQIYKQLAVEMRPFTDMLTFTLDGKKHQGKLRILIKDKTSFEAINSIKPSFLALAGDINDIDKNVDSEKMPLIELNFNELTTWKGTGNIPFEDFTKIKSLVAKIHAQNKKVSIVNCPAYKPVAEFVKSANIDFINTQEDLRMIEFFQ